MSGTIETTNNNIILKINSITELINIFKKTDIKINNKLLKEIDELKEEYSMGTINILSHYFLVSANYRSSKNELEKKRILIEKSLYFTKYQNFIRKENFITKLDRIINLIKIYIKVLEESIHNYKKNTPICLIDTKKVSNNSLDLLQEIYKHLKYYSNTTISKNVKEVIYEICICKSKMNIDSMTSTLICKNCGIIKKLYGTVFEDDQFYYQEGQRTKHGTYDPSKHCRFWVERIQARETTEIPESVIHNIKICIINNKIKNINQISCNEIRKYLRQTHNSKYNEHVPLIRKLITGITPPQLTEHEMQLINIYFDKVIHIFDEIKPPEKTNCPYHPYFIYKIIEQILNKDSDRIRKHQILSCIHLQSRETLVDNDRIFKPICLRIENFTYIPTDRNSQIYEF
jgi:hypothetical protein